MFRVPILLMLLAVGEGVCFYDATPPGKAKLNDDRPTVIIKLQGFSPNVQIAVRFWDDTTAYAFPSNYQLYTDAQGNFLGSLSVDNSNVSISYLIYVDENDNGSWDASDYGAYRSGLTFTNNSVTDTLTYAAGTLSITALAEAAPASGIKTCIYMPTDQSSWTAVLEDSVAEFPIQNQALTLDDWFPVSTVIPGPVTTNTYLPSGTYNETCVTDLDADGRVNGGDSVALSAASPITIP